MKVANSIQQSGVPLSQQLLVLIPLLRVIEESRKAGVNRLAPLRLDVTHRSSGALNIALSETHLSGDTTDNPEITIAINSHTRNSKPLSYQEVFVFAWTYLCSVSSMSESEQKTMYERFLVAWALYVIRHEETIKSMGLK